MKLLGWMHRKFRQNSSEPIKDFAIGNSCTCLIGQPSLDDQHYCPKQNYCPRPFNKSQREYNNNLRRKSFACLEGARADGEYLEEESSELFHGFLAIGTLGIDPIPTDPSTPTFCISNITEKETEATENELKQINDELEKVLGLEGKEFGCNDSGRNSHGSSITLSGRNSYVSTGRSSHGSIITLNGKTLDDNENNGNEAIVCPLQDYLFGSAIGLPETTQTRKENRTSLGELFQKTKVTDDNIGGKFDKGEKKESDKSTVNLVKKKLKKRMVQSSSRHSTLASGGTIDSGSSEKKLHKILNMFHKKVHPESSTTIEKPDRPLKNEMKRNNAYDWGYNEDLMDLGDDITIYPQRDLSKKSTHYFKSQYNPHQVIIGGNDSNGNKEHWIKTDADYLVLEL